MSNISKIRVNEIDYDIIDSSALHGVATDTEIGGIKSGGDISIDKDGSVSVINSINSINLVEKSGELKNCGSLEIPVFIQNGIPIETNIKPSNIEPKVAAEIPEAGTLIEYSRADHIHPLQKNVEHSDTSTIAEQLGNVDVGSVNEPIYLQNGRPATCNIIPTTNIKSKPKDLEDEASAGTEENMYSYSRIDHIHKLPVRFNSSLNIGSKTKPIYFENGVPTECDEIDVDNISADLSKSELTGYTRSEETNENLLLAPDDNAIEAFGKLEKAIIDNEQVFTNATENIAYSVGLDDKLQYKSNGTITASSRSISEAIELLDYYISTHTNSINTNSLNTYQQNYTETYEWKDGNPDNEDRTGYFVKLESGKLIKCSGSTGFILGITTSTNGKFSIVSLIGTNIINQDGTLVEGEYCTINKNGIATKTTTQKYYVLNIIDKNKAKIIFK